MEQEIALKLSGLEKSFLSVKVLSDIDLELRKGEILGLVGENGAGKSTMMNIIGGILKKDAGSMEVDGQIYEPANPACATAAGIAFIHQELNLFSNLSVAENMFIDQFPTNFAGAIKYGEMRQIAQKCIDEYELPVTPDAKVETLSTGIRQMVEISKGLMKNARIMIFDEPTTSLSYTEKEKLFATIHDLKMRGISLIYISHILEDVFQLCDRITVLRDGRIIGTDNTVNLTKKSITKMMVGREINQVYPAVQKKIKDNIMLEARNVKYGSKVNGVSLSLHEGEIVGLYGLMGSGRTEFVKALFGVEPMDEGEVYVNSSKLDKLSPEICIRHHMAYVTEDRHNEGLIMTKPVGDNLILVKITDILRKFGVVNRTKEKSLIAESISDLKIKVTDPETCNANSLSGGNQQKIVFGKWVMKAPEIFILDEPTRGVDVGAKYEIYTIINNMARRGSSILFVSSEMEELMGTCDRILVMKKGCISGELSKEHFNQQDIVSLAF